MDKRPGIYALVMRLLSARRLKIGRLGTFDFPAGWYVYQGSAHGPGGLRARTNRHRRDDKIEHWNVDFMRSYAAIHEIWFSHEPSFREHDWAKAVASMTGAGCPAPDFGAHCNESCTAHFYHFERRPYSAAFQSAVQGRVAGHSTVFVEFLLPHRIDHSASSSRRSPILTAYDRGRRFLELRRVVDSKALSGNTNPPLAVFSRDRISSTIVRQLALDLRVGEQELKCDAKFAEAVDTIVANCGEPAFEVLLRSKIAQDRESILKLSRKSRERQRHRIEGVAEGRMRSVRPQGSDRVPDTKTFQKINSRLARARGSISCCQSILAAHGRRELSADFRADVATTARQCDDAIRKFARLLPMTALADVPKTMIAKPNRGAQGSKLGLAGMARQLKSGLAMIEKNVRDLPVSSYVPHPTPHELALAKYEIAQIRDAIRGIIVLVVGDGAQTG